MMPTFCMVDFGFAGTALRLAVDRAATFFFAALVLAGARLDALAFFGARLAGFREVVVRFVAFFFAAFVADFFATMPPMGWGTHPTRVCML
jgi:hypothetical protein